MMDSQSYYRTDDPDGCNIAVTDDYLLVNCTGITVLNRPFTTWRPQGRRDFYLMYLYRGSLTFHLHKKEVPCDAGHFILYKPGYATGYSKSDDKEMVYYWVHFSGSMASSILDSCRLDSQTPFLAGVDPVAMGLFQDLFNQFLRRDDYFRPTSASLLLQILLHLRKAADKQMSSQVDQDRLVRSLAFIHKHYSQQLTVRQLANIEHLSVSRYSALFRACMAQSPQGYIIDLRLRMAAELLQRTDLSIKQVAYTVGYADQLYFSRLFRSRKGLSPSQFQLMHQTDDVQGSRQVAGLPVTVSLPG
jgi:AraC-like DNA-binding protein